MSSILLIHGYAVHLTSPLVRPALGSHKGFRTFIPLIQNRQATVFSWGLEKQVSFLSLLNPFFLKHFYHQEREVALHPNTHTELQALLQKERPRIIVCHSMGSVLLNGYLKTYSLPPSVEAIVFVQSDLSVHDSINFPVPVYNLYCPWDPTLLVSSLFNRSARVGLRKIKHPSVQNILFPLNRPFNLHTSSIRDPKLRTWILSLLEKEQSIDTKSALQI